MTNTAVGASSPNINGNIGSCEIKTTDTSLSSFVTQTTAINSCNGEIVANSVYTSVGSIILMVFAVLFAFVFLAILFKTITD